MYLRDLLNKVELDSVVYIKDDDTEEVLYNDYVVFSSRFIENYGDEYYVAYIKNNADYLYILVRSKEDD